MLTPPQQQAPDGPEEALKRLNGFRERVKYLETQLSATATEDRVYLASILRQLYPVWLGEVRAYYASSQPAQEEEQRVIEGLKQIRDMLAAS